MSGIEAILQVIEEEGRAAARRISGEAGEQEEALLLSAREEAEIRCREIEEQGDRESREILERGASGAQLAARRMLLEAKQEILNDLLRKARERVDTLEPETYFALLMRIAAKNALPREGELLLSPKDRERLPAHFEQALSALLPKGGSLRVSRETREIDGGCVLLYGGVEENCSLPALFSADRDEMADIAQAILFREE